MGRRKMIELPGVSHKRAAIPLAVKMDDWLFTSAIPGRDPDTELIPVESETQVELLFQHLSALLVKAGGSWDDAVSLQFYVRDVAIRELINTQCSMTFPHLDDQPVRHTTIVGAGSLPAGIVVQGQLVAKIRQ